MKENQEEINKAQWHDEQNWHGPNWMAFYVSHLDSRTWVPKKIPWMGWTINLGKTAGKMWLVFFIALLIVVALGPLLFGLRFCPLPQ